MPYMHKSDVYVTDRFVDRVREANLHVSGSRRYGQAVRSNGIGGSESLEGAL